MYYFNYVLMTNELGRIVNNGLLLDSLSFTVLYIGDQF